MDKGVLQRYSTRPEREGDPNVLDLDPIEDLGCFGYLRGIRDRAVMLELRKKSGNCLAIAYSWIDRIEYDPSTGIHIHAGAITITIQGKNLNAEASSGRRLFEGLTRHRVSWIQEAKAERSFEPGGDSRVEAIDWSS